MMKMFEYINTEFITLIYMSQCYYLILGQCVNQITPNILYDKLSHSFHICCVQQIVHAAFCWKTKSVYPPDKITLNYFWGAIFLSETCIQEPNSTVLQHRLISNINQYLEKLFSFNV